MAFAAAVFFHERPLSRYCGQFSLLSGGAFCLAAACSVFWAGHSSELALFNLPLLGPVILRLDAVSAFFMLPVGLFSIVTGASAGAYSTSARERARSGLYWFFVCVLSGGMALVLSASSSFFFLVSWEIMSLAPFFILLLNRNRAESRSAAWLYLVMAHLAALLLILLFTVLTAEAESVHFGAFAALGESAAEGWDFKASGLLFVLALIGFGVKCGFVPVHLWLPAAYSAAPPHITPLLSGAMINMGLYGLVRVIAFLGPVQAWWAYSMIGVGLFTAFMGILLALAQSEIKRTLAYSSAENMGIAALGLGFGLLSVKNGHAGLAVLAYSGALLHILNHSIFKGLLFFCAGNVQKQAKTTNVNVLGGLLKSMPVTGICFAVGCASLTALPPLNGFAGEFLLYLTFAMGGNMSNTADPAWLYWGSLFIMAMVGGLALLTFTKIYGLVFLGNPRTSVVGKVSEAPLALRGLALFLAFLCMVLGLASPLLVKLLSAVLPAMPGLEGLIADASGNGTPGFELPYALLLKISLCFFVFYSLLGALEFARRRLLRKRRAKTGPTWDCGYARPSGRMQYTSASFTQPSMGIMKFWLKPKWFVSGLRRYFPQRGHAEMDARDISINIWERVIFHNISRLAGYSKHLQHGVLNVYILYILLALIATLTWRLW